MRNQQTTQNADVSKIDYGIILSVFLLAIISVLTIYSTTVLQTDGDISTTIMQIVWYGIGIIAAAIVMHFDSEQLWKVAPIAYGAGILLLFLVLIFYDRNTYYLQGAKSWFRFGGVTFQPSEVVKVALIIMLARVITEHNMQIDDRTEKTDMNLLLKIAMWSAPPLLLVILQNDLGTTLVFLAIIIGMTFLSGVSWKILLPVFGTIGAIGSLLIYLVVYNREVLLNFGFQNYQFARIDSWLDPFGDSTGDAYQLAQSMKAIGSGKLIAA